MGSTYEIKQAKISRRMCAFLIDLLIFIIIFSALMFLGVNYNMPYKSAKETYDDKCLQYNLVLEKEFENGEKYTTTWTLEDFLLSSFSSKNCQIENNNDLKNGVSEECQKEYNDFLIKQNEEFFKDEIAMNSYYKVLRYHIGFYAFASIIPLFIINFIFPSIFKNGQTLGKKALKLGLISKNQTRVKLLNVGLRFCVGIFILEVFPFMLYFAIPNIFSVGLLSGMALSLVNLLLLFFTNNRTMIHDFIGGTIVVDLNTTTIFNSFEKIDRIQGM